LTRLWKALIELAMAVEDSSQAVVWNGL